MKYNFYRELCSGREDHLSLLFFIFYEDKQGGKIMAKRDYFFCYNVKVAEFLKSKGVYFITVAKDLNTGKVFSLYEINEQLQKALDEYKSASS
jgi:hypothetical protein